jgi:hypothetical protein
VKRLISISQRIKQKGEIDEEEKSTSKRKVKNHLSYALKLGVLWVDGRTLRRGIRPGGTSADVEALVARFTRVDAITHAVKPLAHQRVGKGISPLDRSTGPATRQGSQRSIQPNVKHSYLLTAACSTPVPRGPRLCP